MEDKSADHWLSRNWQFLDKTAGHPARLRYIRYALENNIRNILEIGAGDMVEAKRIKELSPDTNYTIVDIAPIFLECCRKATGFNCVESPMDNLPFADKSFELVYLNSVIEHSPSVRKLMRELSRVSNRFYFTLFKWRMNGGGIKSKYHKSKSYWSTYFNIQELLRHIETIGEIESKMMVFADGRDPLGFDEYASSWPSRAEEHRTGDYLTIVGKWRSDVPTI